MSLFRRGKIVSHFDVIVGYTDQLLHNWRAQVDGQVHIDIVEQCLQLILAIFGLIGFNCDLHLLDGNHSDQTSHQFLQALHDTFFVFRILFLFPRFVPILYTKFSPRYLRSRKFLKDYVNEMIDRELSSDSELRAKRKKTCLITSLVSSLQEDEQAEAGKREEDKKG